MSLAARCTASAPALIYETEQTSDVQQQAMRWTVHDGSPVPDQDWHANLKALTVVVRLDPGADFKPALCISITDGVKRVFCCPEPHAALERWHVGSSTEPLHHSSDPAQIHSDVGAPMSVRAGAWEQELGRVQTRLLPAALREVEK